MRRLGLLALALSLGACAAGATGQAQDWEAQDRGGAQDWGNPYYGSYYGSYGTTAYNYSYGSTARAGYTHSRTARRRGSAELDAEVLAEINRLRADPRRYAEHLRAYRADYHGEIVRASGEEVGVRTHEGVAALDEAIADLERHGPLKPLAADRHLYASATKLVEEEGPSGAVGHISRDGQTPGQRMREAGVWAGITEEDISFGQASAAAVVRQLIIDDGVPGRGHRASLLEPGLSVAGVSCGQHARYGWMCVIDMAGALARG